MDRRTLLKSGLYSLAGFHLFNHVDVDQSTQYHEPKMKLNANENPYGPSENAKTAILNHLNSGNRYPRPYLSALKKDIAKAENVPSDYIFIGAGSAEILGAYGLLCGIDKQHIISAYPTFPLLMAYATSMGSNWTKVPLTKQYIHNLSALSSSIKNSNSLIYLCNPNNPTGTQVSTEQLKSFIRTHAPDHDIFVDEAYIEYLPNYQFKSMVSMVETFRNVLICRTFSKLYGLAGLRVGYIIGHPDKINRLKKKHTGFQLTPSTISLAAAQASLGDQFFIKEVRKKNERARSVIEQTMEKANIEIGTSVTNFIYVPLSRLESNFRKEMDKKKIALAFPSDQHYVRISIGVETEMKALATHIKPYLK